MKKERVDVRVEPELLKELDNIAQRSGQSRSSIIRDAIDSYVIEKEEDLDTIRFQVNITYDLAEKINRAILNTDAKNPNHAVEKALDYWTRDIDDYRLNRKPKLDDIAAENVSKRSALQQMRDFEKLLARK